MNAAGVQKDATWYFMQWATSMEHDLFGARKMDFVNPVRASVWKDAEFRGRIDKSYPGYLNQHDSSAPGATSRTDTGTRSSPARCAARHRRSPAII